jgi:2-oxo-4-hydroxy-4-carboxy-5-ureidoimidazoline decarboxylase
MTPSRLEALNALDEAAFTQQLGGIYEHSPWVARRAWAWKPFASVEALHAAMQNAVAHASREEQLELIRAHPELLGKLAAAQLTDASRSEQASAGLERCTREERERMQALNARYRERFGMPFIVAVRGLDWGGIIARMEARLPHDPATEHAGALAQIGRIALLRLEAFA